MVKHIVGHGRYVVVPNIFNHHLIVEARINIEL